MILPYLEQAPLYNSLIWQNSRTNADWSSYNNANRTACSLVIPVFRCPSMAVPEHMNYNTIPGRVPVSYRCVADSLASSDDKSTRPAPYNTADFPSLEQVPLDGVMYGESSTKMRDITDGTSSTLVFGESYTDPDYTKDNQGMDYFAFFSPQITTWTWGKITGTEYSEAAGSTVERINSRLYPATHGVIMEMCFGSYHTGGAFFTMCDGSVHFLSENMDLKTYRSMGSRAGGEVVGEF
jgi:hypothetical protein